MAHRSKYRLTYRPSRHCAFCGKPWRTVSRSDEHVWPKWVRQHAGDLRAERSSQSAGLVLSADGRRFEESHNPLTTRRGSILHTITREVCRPCNNGWMSALETEAKPYFLALAHAAERGTSVVLSPEHAAVLARWAEKTAITSELTDPPPWVSTPGMRRALMTGRDVLPSSFVLAAGHLADLGLSTAQAHLQISDTPRPAPSDPSRHSLLDRVSFGADIGLVVMFNICRVRCGALVS